MNVFVIPSWYPSADYPINGIMIYEQTKAFCQLYPEVNIGVSIWGQKDKNYLLLAEDHIKNLPKLFSRKAFSYKEVLPNYREYTSPVFTWTRSILKGNFNNIVRANLANLKAFENDFGPVQLIHAHSGHPAGNIALEVSKHSKIPMCLTEHMGPFPSRYASDQNGQLTPFHKTPYIHSVKNIAVSLFQADMMLKQGVSNITVISNFVDECFFKPEEENNAKEDFTFFTLTRLVHEKGIEDLLYAVKELIIQCPNITVKIAGSGPDEITFKVLTQKLKIDKSVLWLGDINREQALNEFQNCNAFILPSHYESFGIVYVEAIACGKPIIATRCGGPESIVNETNGLLVDKGNPEQLADAMIDMVKNYNRYDSTAIREDFINRFSKKVVVPQLMQLYKDIITETP